MSALTPTKAELRRSIQVLKRALELCGTPDRWTQLVYARCPHGREMGATSPYAVSFCLIGALMRSAEEYRLRAGITPPRRRQPLADFNGVPLTPTMDIALAACSFVISEHPARGIEVRRPDYPFSDWLRARQHDPDTDKHLYEGHLLDCANDHPDTRHEDVVEGLTSAIEVLQQELAGRTTARPLQQAGQEQS